MPCVTVTIDPAEEQRSQNTQEPQQAQAQGPTSGPTRNGRATPPAQPANSQATQDGLDFGNLGGLGDTFSAGTAGGSTALPGGITTKQAAAGLGGLAALAVVSQL